MNLVGCWSLTGFEVRFADGRPVVHPFGEHPQGRIVYTAEGVVSAVLSAPGRTGSADLETFRGASDADKVAWFDGFLAYSGRWSLDGDEVVHHIDLALAPAMVGQAVRRKVTPTEGGLVLSYERTARSGVTRTFVLSWERCP